MSSLLLLALLSSNPLVAQGLDQPLTDQPIKKGYDSWSLFLVCNPDWLLSENRDQLEQLYRRYLSFGRAIGRKHLAVWFWRCAPDQEGSLNECIDSDRNSDYCSAYNLMASDSPYVLVTTTYPDLPPSDGGRATIKMAGLSATDISALLGKLTDQMLSSRIDQRELDSKQYWLDWQNAFERAVSLAGSALRKVKLRIDAKVVSIEVDGGR